MKVLSLAVEGVLGAPNGEYAFSAPDDVPNPITLVTGASGSGKSSLLRAIAVAKEAIGAYGAPASASTVLQRGRTEGRLHARWLLTDGERLTETGEVRLPSIVETTIAIGSEGFDVATATPEVELDHLRATFARYRAAPSASKVELFPARRHLHPELWRELPGELDAVREASLRLSLDPSKYGFVRRMFFDLVLAQGMRLQHMLATEGIVVPSEELDLLAPHRRALARLTQRLRLDHVEAGNAGQVAVWFARPDGARIELADLSDSEAQAVLFAATFQRQGLDDSLVLLDTPELHIPDVDQAAFFDAVCSLGVNNQVIAATSSRSILQRPGVAMIELGPSV